MLPNYEVLLVDARFVLLGVTLVWVVNNHPFLEKKNKQTKKNRAIELCDIKSPAIRMCFGQHLIQVSLPGLVDIHMLSRSADNAWLQY